MREKRKRAYGPERFFQDFGLLLIFVVVVGVLVVLSPNAFARPANLIGIVKQASINGVLAMGMMFVIISGGIDLSVGSIVAFTGVVAASLAHPGQFPLAVTIVGADRARGGDRRSQWRERRVRPHSLVYRDARGDDRLPRGGADRL